MMPRGSSVLAVETILVPQKKERNPARAGRALAVQRPEKIVQNSENATKTGARLGAQLRPQLAAQLAARGRCSAVLRARRAVGLLVEGLRARLNQIEEY